MQDDTNELADNVGDDDERSADAVAYGRSPLAGGRSARRWIVLTAAGALAVIALAFAAVRGTDGDTAALTSADSRNAPFQVLHSAEVYAHPGAPIVVRASTLCAVLAADGSIPPPDERAPQCRLEATAIVYQDEQQREVSGATSDGIGFTFPIGVLAEGSSLRYQLRFSNQTGDVVVYPSPSQTLLVSAPRPEAPVAVAAFGQELARAEREVAVGYGDSVTQLGANLLEVAASELPSAFALTPTGRVLVADWVNGRIADITDGSAVTVVELPVDAPVDLAVSDDGTMYVATLGSAGAVYELEAGGRFVEVRRDFVVGLATRGSSVWLATAPNVWRPLRVAGEALSAAEADALVTSSLPSSDDAVPVRASWRGESELLVQVGTRTSLIELSDAHVGEVFVAENHDDGAVVVFNAWNDSSNVTLALTLDAAGRMVSSSALQPVAGDLEAWFGGVKYDADSGVAAVVHTLDEGLRIGFYAL